MYYICLYTVARWLLWLIVYIKLPKSSRARPQCNNHVVIALAPCYCTVAVQYQQYSLLPKVNWFRAYCTERVVPYCHQSAQPLVLRAKTFSSFTVRYAVTETATMATTWFRSIATQLSHCLAYSLSFSVPVFIRPFPRIIATV